MMITDLYLPEVLLSNYRSRIFGKHINANGFLNAKVLLLNQSFEPLTICNVKKALLLVLLEKAEVILNDKKIIRSQNGSYNCPSIIRLKRYVKVPFKSVVLNRRNVLKRDKHKCAYCGRSDRPLTVDHIIPKSKGGANTWENLITACISCNNLKGDQTLKEAGLKLRFKPYRPNYILFIKNMSGRIYEKWNTYLFE